VHEAAGEEVRGLDQLAGVGVDDRHHGDDALLGERAPVLQRRLGRAADGHAVDVDVAGGHLAGDRGPTVDEVDDDAVLRDDHPAGVDARTDREVAVGT
jgi:hypothetical protein